jgi:hypothetical protein
MDDLTAGSVVERLRAESTRAGTLEALGAVEAPVSRDVALAAAPALVDIAAHTNDREELEHSTLLLARLLDEATPDPAALYGVAFAGDDRAAEYRQAHLLHEATQRALATAGHAEGSKSLTLADARCYACICAYDSPASVRGHTAPEAAAGRTFMSYLKMVNTLCLHLEHATRLQLTTLL